MVNRLITSKHIIPTLKGRIIAEDFLKLDLKSIFHENFCIIGNYPYNISSQIFFFKVLDYRDRITCCSGMIQKSSRTDLHFLAARLTEF